MHKNTLNRVMFIRTFRLIFTILLSLSFAYNSRDEEYHAESEDEFSVHFCRQRIKADKSKLEMTFNNNKFHFSPGFIFFTKPHRTD
jgi:hypothetical protein